MSIAEKLTFRALTVETNTWIYRQPFHIRGTWYMYNSRWDKVAIRPDTICRFTGLKDKYDTNIYEGDIISHPIQKERIVYYPFDENVASFGLEEIKNGWKNTLADAHIYEIVGNVFQHPHLLKE